MSIIPTKVEEGTGRRDRKKGQNWKRGQEIRLIKKIVNQLPRLFPITTI